MEINLLDIDLEKVYAFLDEDGKEVDKKFFLENFKEGYWCFLVSFPLTNVISLDVVVVSNSHRNFYGPSFDDAFSSVYEWYQNKHNEEIDLSEDCIIIRTII